jgi:hypothetical protein
MNQTLVYPVRVRTKVKNWGRQFSHAILVDSSPTVKLPLGFLVSDRLLQQAWRKYNVFFSNQSHKRAI